MKALNHQSGWCLTWHIIVDIRIGIDRGKWSDDCIFQRHIRKHWLTSDLSTRGIHVMATSVGFECTIFHAASQHRQKSLAHNHAASLYQNISCARLSRIAPSSTTSLRLQLRSIVVSRRQVALRRTHDANTVLAEAAAVHGTIPALHTNVSQTIYTTLP